MGSGRPIEGIDAIAIQTPRNESYEPGVEYLVADALRREALRRGGPELIEDPAAADLVLSGYVVHVRSLPRGFSSVVLALEYELTVGVVFQARRSDGTELPVDHSRMTETERYLASADVEVQRKNKQEALRRVSAILATRLFDTVTSVLSP